MVQQRVARVLGIFLVIEGVWGLFGDVVFGVLSTNRLHASIHIVLGILGIAASRSLRARPYLLGVGALLVVVGCLRFVPGASDFVISLLNVNQAVAVFNIVIGVVCLLAARTARVTPVRP